MPLGRDTTVTKMYDPFAGKTVEVSKVSADNVTTKAVTIGALIPVRRTMGTANNLTHIRNSKGIGGKADHLLTVRKDEPAASGGRYAAGTAFGLYHSAAAGKKGRKLGAVGSSVGHNVAGSVPGQLILRAGLKSGNKAAIAGGAATSLAGSLAGNHRAVTMNQRKGRYKPEMA